MLTRRKRNSMLGANCRFTSSQLRCTKVALATNIELVTIQPAQAGTPSCKLREDDI